MTVRSTARALGACLLSGALATATPAQERADPGLGRLEIEVQRLAGDIDGQVGVGIRHLETGREVFLLGSESFPMASTYKVPIAVQLLTRVDRGELTLDRMIDLTEADLHPGSGTISRLLDDPGVSLSALNLLELMLLISDNSATDLCLQLAGGPDAVNSRMAELGIDGVSVDRPTSLLIGDWLGIEGLPEDGRVTPDEYATMRESLSDEQRERASNAFSTDPRDQATPAAMVALLDQIWRGEALSSNSTALLIDVLERVETGQDRLKGLLPSDVTVAHKTGTIGGTTNDVGTITLPQGAGHVIVVVFVKQSERPVSEREQVIAQVARAAYDYFLFNPG